MKLRAAVLFAGIGGWEIACQQLGIEVAWACEWDAWKAERYRERFPDVALYGDVASIDGREIVERHGPIDLLLGSPPCTDISCANAAGQGVDGESSRYYFEATRLAGTTRALGCCFENSDRLRIRGADRVLAEMEAQGYACWPLVVAAGHAGAPHIRRRSWLVAADAERLRLRDELRRLGGTRGQGQAQPENDADADCVRQPLTAPGNAEVGGCARADGAAAESDGRGSDGDRLGWRHGAVGPADWSQIGNSAGRTRHRGAKPCHPDRARLAEWQGFAGDHGAQRSTVERAALHPWDHAGECLAGHLRMADGVPPGLARKWRSAYGDAVVVPVVRAILSGMVRTLL